jgi:para-nitrobenzyl esterase
MRIAHLKTIWSGLLICGLLSVAVQAVAAGKIPETDPANTVRIDSGLISGQIVAEGTLRVFKGIPFAAPPVGPLRWKPPQPVQPWGGVRLCTEFGPWCPQPPPLIGKETGSQSEDCLYLNVWTPAKSPDDRLPVMVWIHGGGWTTGSGSQQVYRGDRLAEAGVVVVTINYRLGPFGFFAHPLLSAEADSKTSGNYGMLDQIEALRWVHRNIAAFGGNPDCVTIFGESAGAGSIARLLVIPQAKGLFHRAIIESGGLSGFGRHLREPWYQAKPAEQVGEEIAAKLLPDKPVDILDALRAKSALDVLLAASPTVGLFRESTGVSFSPIVDGWLLPTDPELMVERGQADDVPVIIGVNADEATIFTSKVSIRSETDYRLLLERVFGDRAAEALRLFPVCNGDYRAAFNDMTGVTGFVSEARHLARELSCAGRSNVYLYYFSRVPPLPAATSLGAFHSSEISYVFGTPEIFTPIRGASAVDRAVSQAMLSAWICFARTGSPNGEGLINWPAYDSRTDAWMEFGDTIAVRYNLLKEGCDLGDSVRTVRQTRDRKAFVQSQKQ